MCVFQDHLNSELEAAARIGHWLRQREGSRAYVTFDLRMFLNGFRIS